MFYNVCSALANAKLGRPLKMAAGRPRKVSPAGVQVLANQLTQSSLSLKSIHVGEEFENLVKAQMAAESKNGFGLGNAEEISDKTLDRLIEEIKATKRSAKVKTPARSAAHDDIRSPLALCGVLGNVFEKVDASLFVSSDDVSILVNDNKEPHIVLTTQEAIKLLKKTNTSVSVTQAESKHRVVTFNVSISAGFQTVCKVVKFADRNFQGVLKKPKIIDVGRNMYFCFYPYGMEDAVLNEAVYRKCILPSADALRTQLKEGEGVGMSDAEVHTQSQSQQSVAPPEKPVTSSSSNHATSSSSAGVKSTPTSSVPAGRGGRVTRSSSSQHSSQQSVDGDDRSDGEFSQRGVEAGVDAAIEFMSTATPEQMRKRYEWICLACDGAYGQITAITDQLSDYAYRHALNTLMMKYGAGRSLSESPNDLGWMHSILHRCFKKYKFKYGSYDDPSGKVWADMKSFLQKHLNSTSFNTVWRCFCHAEEFLDKAFTKSNIRSAFLISGIAPLDFVTVMSHNPHFRTLSKEDAAWIISDAIPLVSEVCAEKGFVPEEDLKRILAVRPSTDNSVPRKGMALNDMSTNRQRALVLNHPEFLVQLRQRREEKAAAAAAAAEAKQAAAERALAKKKKAAAVAASKQNEGSSTEPAKNAKAPAGSRKRTAVVAELNSLSTTPLVASGTVAATADSTKKQKRPLVAEDALPSAPATSPHPCSSPGCGNKWRPADGPRTLCGWPRCKESFCSSSVCQSFAETHRAGCSKRRKDK